MGWSGSAGGREVECYGQGRVNRTIIEIVVNTQLQAGYIVSPSGACFTSFFLLVAWLDPEKVHLEKKSESNTDATKKTSASADVAIACKASGYETASRSVVARWMDPKVGRFVGVDPYEGDPQAPISLHRYLYANACPVNFIDPSGEMSFSLGDFSISQTITGILRGAQTALRFNYHRILLLSTAAAGPSKVVLDHLLNKHSYWRVTMQVPHVLAKGGRAAADAYVRSRSYFPIEWSEARIQQAIGLVHRDAIRKGIAEREHAIEIAGEKVTIFLRSGKVESAYGAVKLTLDDFGL